MLLVLLGKYLKNLLYLMNHLMLKSLKSLNFHLFLMTQQYHLNLKFLMSLNYLKYLIPQMNLMNH
jgi:hypothetical protein